MCRIGVIGVKIQDESGEDDQASLEKSGADLSSLKAGAERVMYVDLGSKVYELVRHWSSGMSVRVSTKPGNGLTDLSFFVAAPVPDAGAQEKMAQTVAFCQMLAR